MNDEKSWLMIHASLIVALCAMASFVGYVAVYMVWKPAIDPDVNGTIIGILGTGGFTAAVQYWLGSSSGSTDKNKQIGDLLKKQEGAPPPAAPPAAPGGNA